MTMKFICWSIFGLFGSIFLVLYLWQPVSLQTYLLPTTLKHGWVAIEYDNPNCSSLKRSSLGQEYVIPESGYLCTSSPMEKGLTYQRYYLVDDKNKRTRLYLDKQIFVRESIFVKRGSCKVTAETFWYGPKDKINNEKTDFIEKFHPECR